MKESANLVSIIIPCYKMGRFIGEALESIGRQSYENWEVIAVDDCGPEDGTREAVEAFAAEHPEKRIVYRRHAENKGVSAARNTAIEIAKGEYLAFLDPDDLWMNFHLERHLGVASGGKIVSASLAKCFNLSLGDQGYEDWGLTRPETRIFPDALAFRNAINPSVAVVPRVLGGEVVHFDEAPEIQHVEDWDLWFQIISKGASFTFIHEATVWYRRHEGAATADIHKMRSRTEALCRKNYHIWLPLLASASYGTFQQMNQMRQESDRLSRSWILRAEFYVRRLLNRLFRS